MRKSNQVLCCLVATLYVAAMAVAEEADDPTSPGVVVPELVVAPLPGDLTSLSEDRTPVPPQVISSARSPSGCYHYSPCCPSGVCRNRCRGCLSRMKLCLQESHWGYPEEFCELPLGARLYAHLNTQVANGAAAQMVLYRYDFYDGIFNHAFRLNHHGLKRLKRMVRMLECNLYPVIVEYTPEEPQLAAARRTHVLKSLEKSGFAVPEEWVVVGEPESVGLSGEEAIGVYQGMLSQRGQPTTQTTIGTSTLYQGNSTTSRQNTTSSGQ